MIIFCGHQRQIALPPTVSKRFPFQLIPSAFQLSDSFWCTKALWITGEAFWSGLRLFSGTFWASLFLYIWMAKWSRNTWLQDNQLFVQVEKCEFHVSQVLFLGFIVNAGRILMDPTKVKAVTDCHVISSLKQLRRILGFANYCWCFIHNCNSVAAPFEAFISQDTMHVWSWSSEEAFRELKRQTVPNGEELLHWQSWAVKPTLKELNWYKGAEVLGMDAHWLL